MSVRARRISPARKPRRIAAALAAIAAMTACSKGDTANLPPTPTAPTAATYDAQIETGTLAGAVYRIDVPRAWNHGLVVWYHGYAITPVQLPGNGPPAPQLAQFVARGYAVAQSAYAQTGWAIEQGAADSERLRRHFAERHGAPRETFAAGMSMGGALTVLALETNAAAYAGGLALCGALQPSDSLLQRDFALVAAFNYYFPDRLGPWLPVPADYLPTRAVTAKIGEALRAKPEAAQSLLRIWGVGNLQTLADILAFDYAEIGELQWRTHGNPFNNADYIYTGSLDDRALNAGVARQRADAPAAAYLSRWYTPSGNLARPLLALHDPLVPASGAFEYALAVQRTGHAANFVQQFVGREGHCVFTPPEIGRAFDELVDWAHAGTRPPSGALPD